MSKFNLKECVKIHFPLKQSDWHGKTTETLWARPFMSESTEKYFYIVNSPFFTKGISFEDIVSGTRRPDGDGYNVSAVVRHSGHSTYWIIFTNASRLVEFYWLQLEKLGVIAHPHRVMRGEAGAFRPA